MAQAKSVLAASANSAPWLIGLGFIAVAAFMLYWLHAYEIPDHLKVVLSALVAAALVTGLEVYTLRRRLNAAAEMLLLLEERAPDTGWLATAPEAPTPSTQALDPHGENWQSHYAGNVGQAQAVALQWLALLDSGAVTSSWEQSAGLFRGAVGLPAWAKSMHTLRAPLGAVTVRKFQSAKFTCTRPGAPDGEYVIAQYQTEFACKASATETVTLLKEADGSWRVSAYYFK
jgi:hypothetical protein